MNDDSFPIASDGKQRIAGGPSRSGIAGGPLASYVNEKIVQSALEAIVTVDESQRIVMINAAAQRMFGYSAPEVLGEDLSRLIPAGSRTAHAAYVQAFELAGTTERPMGERSQIRGLHANGEEFPLQATICRLDVADAVGPRHFFTALMLDLSEVDKLRSQVDAFNHRLRVICDVAPIAIWIVDGERIVFANRACASLFGAKDPQALVGRSIYALLGKGLHARVRKAVVQALASDLPISAGNERIARADGSVREFEIAVAGLPEQGRMALQMAITDSTRMGQESRALETSREQLRELSASLVDAREEERRRIARELHDELGQRLTALQMELSSLQVSEPEPLDKRRIAAMLGMVEETVASVRRISTDLRPLMLDDLGLVSAIEWLAQGWARRMGIAVKLDIGEDGPPVGEATSIALYRMVQEALTNIARHARATRVSIRMRPRSGKLVLTVRDNGVGFDEQSMLRAGSHGLMGIRERAYMLGGHLEIGNSRRGGGSITVCVPLSVVGRNGASTTLTTDPEIAPPAPPPIRPPIAKP